MNGRVEGEAGDGLNPALPLRDAEGKETCQKTMAMLSFMAVALLALTPEVIWLKRRSEQSASTEAERLRPRRTMSERKAMVLLGRRL